MQTITEYVSSLRTPGAEEYRATARYLSLWQAKKEKYPAFTDFSAHSVALKTLSLNTFKPHESSAESSLLLNDQ